MNARKRKSLNKMKDVNLVMNDFYEKTRNDLADISRLQTKTKHENLFERVVHQKGHCFDKDIGLSKRFQLVMERLAPRESFRDFHSVKSLIEDGKNKEQLNMNKQGSSNTTVQSPILVAESWTHNQKKPNKMFDISKLELNSKFSFKKRRQPEKKNDSYELKMINPVIKKPKPARPEIPIPEISKKILKQRYENINFDPSSSKKLILDKIILPEIQQQDSIQNLTTEASEEVIVEREYTHGSELYKLGLSNLESSPSKSFRKNGPRRTILTSIFNEFSKTEDSKKFEFRRLGSTIQQYEHHPNDPTLDALPSLKNNRSYFNSLNRMFSIESRLSTEESKELLLSSRKNKFQNRLSEVAEIEDMVLDDNNNGKTEEEPKTGKKAKQPKPIQLPSRRRGKEVLEALRKFSMDQVKTKLNAKYNQLNDVSNKINDTVQIALQKIAIQEFYTNDEKKKEQEILDPLTNIY